MARTKAQQEAYLRLMKQQRELKKKQGLETSRDVYDRYGIKNVRTVKQTRNTSGYAQNAARNARDIAGGANPYAWQNREGKTTDFKPIWSLPGLFDALDQIKKDKEKSLDASDPTKTGIYADWKGDEMKSLEEKHDAAAAEKEAAREDAQEEMDRLVEESMTRGIGAQGTPKLEDPNARNLVMLTEAERSGITVKNIAARAAEAAKQAAAQEKVESARRKTAAAAEANDARKQYANVLDTLIYADDVTQDKGFETYAKQGEAAANELIENIKGKGAQLGAALSNDDKTFALMTINDSELKIYAALAGKYGKEIAERYLDAITPELEARAAGKIYDDVENIDNEALKKIARWGVTAGASGQEVRRNLLNLPGAVTGSEDVTGPGTLQKARGRIGENLKGVEKAVHDVTGSVINMLPAVGLSFVPGAGPALSAGYTGATSYSNAYSDAILSGYAPGEAAAYALPSAASEALLGYVTGGVAKMGGSKSLANMAKNALAKAMSNPAVEKALGRAAEAGSEALEEYLQANLDPILRNAVLGEDNEINPISEDKLYAALLGALTSAGMNTATDIAEISDTVKTGKAYNSPDVMQALVQEGLASRSDTSAYGQAQRLAGKLEAGKNVSNFEAGSLAQANEAAIAAEARANAILDKTGVQRAYDPNETVKLADGREVVIVARDGSEYTAIVPGESGYTRITIDEILHRESARRAVDAYLHPEDKADITGKYDYRRVEKTADQTFLDNLQKRYGIKAVIEDLPAGTEAFYDRSTNTIHFAPDSTRADVIGGVAAHELSHAAEDSKHYKAYSDYVLNKLYGGDETALAQAVEAKQEQYIRRGIDLSDAEAVAEIVADYTRSLYKSEADIEALVTGNRGMAQGIYDSIKTTIRKIRAFFKGDEAALANIREYQDLRRAQKLFEKALSTRLEVQADMEAAPAYAIDNQNGGSVTQKLQNNIAQMENMSPVAELTGREFEKGDTSLIDQVSDYFDEIGNVVTNPEIGDVILNRRGVKDSMAHGIGRTKAIAFKAVPAVIENGKIIDAQQNWKGRGADTFIVAAPITINGEEHYLGAVVSKTGENNRFYLHEVIEVDTKKDASASFKTGGQNNLSLPGDASSSLSTDIIPQTDGDVNRQYSITDVNKEKSQFLEKTPGVQFPDNLYKTDFEDNIARFRRLVNGETRQYSLKDTDSEGQALTAEQAEFFKDSKVRDTEGRLIPVYHGTNEDFTVFDKTKTRDIGMHFGTEIAAENAARDGKVGKYYLNANTNKDPIEDVFSSTKFSPAYALETMLDEDLIPYNAYEEIQDKFRDHELYFDTQEDLENRAYERIYEEEGIDAANEAASDRMDHPIADDLQQKYQNLTRKLWKEIETVLKEQGYTGLKYKNDVEDKGSISYVVFDPEQAKRTDNLAPTQNPDIRYSLKDDPGTIARLTKEDANTTPDLNLKEAKGTGDTETSFVNNVENSQFLDDAAKQEIGSDADVRYYGKIANDDVMQAAGEALRTGGEEEVRSWLSRKPNKATPQDVAEGFILLKQYQDKGQYKDMVEVARKLREMGTQAGQVVQTYSILSRMTPEGMVKFAQAELESAWEAIVEGKSKKWIENNASKFELTADETEFIVNNMKKAAELPDGRDKNILLGEIQALLQKKLPSAMGDKFRSWQRVSLLMNPKTNIRNILGNAIMMPARVVSDFIAAPIDRALSKKTDVRTTGVPDFLSYGRGFKKGAFETFDDFRRRINTQNMAGDRFEIGQSPAFNPDHAKTKLGKAMTTALAGLDRVTSFMLEMGDRPFYEAYFINSLNNQMKLNGVDKPTAEMIDIATQDALENTYQDNNGYTRFVNGVRKAMNLKKDFGLGSIVIPFAKTPANLTKALVEMSPAGLVKALTADAVKFNRAMQNGTATPQMQRKFVNNIGKGVAGTIAMLLGAVLADQGIITGAGDEDKDAAAFQKNVLGIQPYSFVVNGKSYTYDWAAPIGPQFAIAADIVNNIKNGKEEDFGLNMLGTGANVILNALQTGGSVVFEQSFLSGIKNFFNSDNLVQSLIEAAAGAPSQGVPAFLNQIGQLTDPTMRTTYEYGNVLGTAGNKILTRLPGANETLAPVVDVYGREVQRYGGDNSVFNVMFNPANVAAQNTLPAADEVWRLYQALGDKAVFPSVAPNYVEYEGKKYDMTSHEKAEYQKQMGQSTANVFGSMIKKEAYKGLSDSEKAALAKLTNEYSSALTKMDYLKSKGIDYTPSNKWFVDARKSDDPAEYIMLHSLTSGIKNDKDKDGNTIDNSGSLKKKDVIDSVVQDPKARQEYYEAFGVNKTVRTGDTTWGDVNAGGSSASATTIPEAKGYELPNYKAGTLEKISAIGVSPEDYAYIDDRINAKEDKVAYLQELGFDGKQLSGLVESFVMGKTAKDKMRVAEEDMNIDNGTYIDAYIFGYSSVGSKSERNAQIREYMNGLSLSDEQKDALYNWVKVSRGKAADGKQTGGSSGGSGRRRSGGRSGGKSAGVSQAIPDSVWNEMRSNVKTPTIQYDNPAWGTLKALLDRGDKIREETMQRELAAVDATPYMSSEWRAERKREIRKRYERGMMA